MLKQSLPYAFTQIKILALLVSAFAALFLLHSLNDAAYARSNESPILAAPTLTATASSATTIELSWTSVSGAAGYELWVWWNSDPGWQPLGDGNLTGTSHTHAQLTAGQTYYYVVTAVDSSGTRGAWSEQASVALPAQSQRPDAPVLTATPQGSTAIDLSWKPVPGASKYELWTWWNSDPGWQRIGGDSLTGTIFSHANLTPGLTYYYTVAAIDAAGVFSDWSAQVQATLPAPNEGLPAPVLSATSNVTATVELNWSPIAGASSYQLWEWLDLATGWERLDKGDLTTTSFTRTQATAGQTYYYSIAAMDAHGTLGAWSQVVSVLVSEAPAIADNSEEKAALVSLFQATDGANWAHKDNWLSSTSIATWFGVKIDEDGRVKELALAGNNLSGTLPDLSALTQLTILDLDFNQLTGSIPDLGALSQLEWLSVSSNRLTGTVPVLNTHTKLERLDLSANQLAGSIPNLAALTQLTDLSLAENNLTGPIPDLSALTNLNELDLGSNRLTGPIPDLSALTNLKVISLSDNELSGTIPALGSLTNLTDLYLGSNQLTGSVPGLSALTNLAWIDLSNNHLTGRIPDISALTNLRFFLLARNQLSGPIQDLSTLTNLTDLSLANNSLTGTIPEISSLVSLSGLDLSNNQLTGRIPDPGSLTRLSRLSLSRNQLTGSIPALGSLTALTALDLGSNQLNGQIPEMSSLVDLTVLILASNQLTGPVPDLSALTKLSSLDLSANQLCLPDDVDPADANAVVSAHLFGLNLPSCAVSFVIGLAAG
ncbi:MAG: leucine-rich repeat domain-containing protein [Caldilineaceae bacterium]|nr:leucine-rich repeat domain-containing protein [Caldilineaceae bacterium]